MAASTENELNSKFVFWAELEVARRKWDLTKKVGCVQVLCVTSRHLCVVTYCYTAVELAKEQCMFSVTVS